MILSPCNKCLVKVVCKEHHSCEFLHDYSEKIGKIGVMVLFSGPMFVILMWLTGLSLTAFQLVLLTFIYMILAIIIFTYCTSNVKNRSIPK